MKKMKMQKNNNRNNNIDINHNPQRELFAWLAIVYFFIRSSYGLCRDIAYKSIKCNTKTKSINFIETYFYIG